MSERARSRRSDRSPLAVTCLFVVPVLVLSCGGGGSGGGGGTVSPSCMEFAGDSFTSGVGLTGDGSSSCNTLLVEASVQQLTDVYGVSFVLRFDPTVVGFRGVNDGASALRDGGVSVETLWTERDGEIEIGITRLAVEDGIDVAAAAELLKIEFERLAVSGSTRLEFDQGRVLGSETPPQDKVGVAWSGGAVVVR